MGKKEKKAKTSLSNSRLNDFDYLCNIKPDQGYVFHSDYFEIDGQVASILSFFHNQGATDNFGAFWGVNLIPRGMQGVTVVLFEQSRRMTEGWISSHQNKTEGIAKIDANEQLENGDSTHKGKAIRKIDDLDVIAQELQDGAAYLHVQYRLLVKAVDLETLESAIQSIERDYIDRFATVKAVPYEGEQKQELSSLFTSVERKEGKGFYFTSTEFAGAYNLVTHGLEDAKGEYVGYMVGDVNNSAVLFDVDGYEHRVVVANENFDNRYDRANVTDLWGSKISQSALMNHHRVAHLIFDGANMDRLGPKFNNLTYRIDLNKGDLNMFEMFGDQKDELSIFPTQMQKLVLMAEQAYETTDNDRSIIRGSLEEIATQFYIDQRMWYENAVVNRDKLRVTGIPHNQVPKLELFVSYLDQQYTALVNRVARDDEKLHALSVLSVTFKNMLSNNGDLFNTQTTSAIDGAKNGRRILYDFSSLFSRGKGIAMAQLVNIIGFAVGGLDFGDTVIIHGAEYIDDSVKTYVTTQLERLLAKGGRVVYLYNNMDKMLADKSFCRFDKADYTVFGNMTEGFVNAYQKSIDREIPADLARLVTNKSNSICYIRRGFDNVVFHQELDLGVRLKRRVR